MNIRTKKIIKALASLKLAVFVILALAAITAAGTIVEARYNDAQAASALVYRTPIMFFIMGLLSVNLIAVMIDRLPWQKKHLPFLFAHVGILILQIGSVMTMKYGLDGTMRFGIGESNRFVVIPITDLQVWASYDGDRFAKLVEQSVDFWSDSPKDKPFKLALDKGELEVLDFEPYMIPSRQVVASPNAKAGSAIRFQLQNDRANINDWLLQSRPDAVAANTFGLARISLGPVPNPLPQDNVLFLTPMDKEKIQYVLSYKDPTRKPLKGILKENDTFQTGWMGLEFRLLRYFSKAEETYEFKKMTSATPLTTSAIQIAFQGRKHWIQLNDVLKVFTDSAAYIVSYGNRRIDIGFDLNLKKFDVGRYQGTMRAATYQSLVTTPDNQDTLISMNEPLKYKGLTFYQASFQEGPNQEPIASILSVNYDPGRWVKYIGSLIIVCGIVLLFYNRRKSARAQAPKKGAI
jgi:hypothetical protein